MFAGGRNIAMKLPKRQYEATLAFYRDTLGLKVISQNETGAVVDFGPIRLNLDLVPGQSQTDIWLEVRTPDSDAAKAHLAAHGITDCNEVEELPEGFDGFWIAAPAGTIHLISGEPGLSATPREGDQDGQSGN